MDWKKCAARFLSVLQCVLELFTNMGARKASLDYLWGSAQRRSCI